jgi:tryptophan-rich sensory protein
MVITTVSKKEIGALFGSILLAEAVGVIAGGLTQSSMASYQSLVQPAFAPPAWLFAPVWGILYLLMGVAAWLVWKSNAPKKEKQSALIAYSVQLAINFVWPLIFFSLDLKGIAFFVILLLLLMVVYTTLKFYDINETAGYLMVPYVIWLSFATILNLTIWLLN